MNLSNFSKFGIFATIFLAAVASAAPQGGTWKVTTTCGPNAMTKRGPWTVDTEIKINNGLMQYQWFTPYNEFIEITNWGGRVTGKSLTLLAQANRTNGESWTYKFDGTVTNPNKMIGNGALYNSENKVVRDCTVDFTLIQGSSAGPSKSDTQVERALDKAWLEAEKQKLEAKQAAIDSKTQEVEKKERQLREREAVIKKEKASKDAANSKPLPSTSAVPTTHEKPKPLPVSSGF